MKKSLLIRVCMYVSCISEGEGLCPVVVICAVAPRGWFRSKL
jgi:hypothetical protein